jgi:hypothetical protein
MSLRWGGARIRHAHRRRSDDLRTLAGGLYLLLAILVVVLTVPG